MQFPVYQSFDGSGVSRIPFHSGIPQAYEHLWGFTKIRGREVMTSSHYLVQALLYHTNNYYRVDPKELEDTPPHVYALAALASMMNFSQAAHWFFWGRDRRHKTSKIVYEALQGMSEFMQMLVHLTDAMHTADDAELGIFPPNQPLDEYHPWQDQAVITNMQGSYRQILEDRPWFKILKVKEDSMKPIKRRAANAAKSDDSVGKQTRSATKRKRGAADADGAGAQDMTSTPRKKRRAPTAPTTPAAPTRHSVRVRGRLGEAASVVAPDSNSSSNAGSTEHLETPSLLHMNVPRPQMGRSTSAESSTTAVSSSSAATLVDPITPPTKEKELSPTNTPVAVLPETAKELAPSTGRALRSRSKPSVLSAPYTKGEDARNRSSSGKRRTAAAS